MAFCLWALICGDYWNPAVLNRFALLLLPLWASLALAQEAPATRQTVYLPVYSHIYHGELDRKTGQPGQSLVSTHISIRNLDMKQPVMITSARYYDTDGKLIREFLPSPKSVRPLGTLELFVPRSDISGGSGANFIIEWASERGANPPLIEALHGDIREARTLFFITTGRPIQTR